MTRGPFFSISRRIDLGRPLSVKIVKEGPKGRCGRFGHLEELGVVYQNIDFTRRTEKPPEESPG